MKTNSVNKKGSLNSIRKELQRTHLVLIIVITILFSIGGAFISIKENVQSVDQNLINNTKLLYRLYNYTKVLGRKELCQYFNSVCNELVNVDVISIVDTKHVRLYHTNNSLIGTIYDGKIPDFKTETNTIHVFEETGPSGPQYRTYSSIYDENGTYCGFIMTIVLKTSIRSAIIRTSLLFLVITVGAIIIEIFISEAFSKRIKQKLLGYEPDTFSSMFTIRDNILESINDGIIAVNKDKDIEFINSFAKRILKFSNEEKINSINSKVFIKKFLDATFTSGKSIFGIQEKTLDGTELLIDCIPVKKDDKVCGAVAILHDRTEYTKLMEDLSGTKYLVDSMRANNHDFTNKLHVILGLIQIGQYDKAVSYIENISIIQRETLSRIMHSVDNPAFAALLIGKISRSNECNVKFILKEGLSFKDSDVNIPSQALITIAGNLIDNALDAMNFRSTDDFYPLSRELVFGVFTKPGELLISVEDKGCGIPEDIKDKVFENGFSTKGKGRGIGLFHVKQLVENLGGTIRFESQQGKGTSFIVKF